MSTNLKNLLPSFFVIILIIFLIIIFSLWFIFKKANYKGYIALIPFYNIWLLFVISGLKGWLCLIPIINIIMLMASYYKLSKKFGKTLLFSLITAFLPFIGLPLIAFNKNSQYLIEDVSFNKSYEEKSQYNYLYENNNE